MNFLKKLFQFIIIFILINVVLIFGLSAYVYVVDQAEKKEETRLSELAKTYNHDMKFMAYVYALKNHPQRDKFKVYLSTGKIPLYDEKKNARGEQFKTYRNISKNDYFITTQKDKTYNEVYLHVYSPDAEYFNANYKIKKEEIELVKTSDLENNSKLALEAKDIQNYINTNERMLIELWGYKNSRKIPSELRMVVEMMDIYGKPKHLQHELMLKKEKSSLDITGVLVDLMKDNILYILLIIVIITIGMFLVITKPFKNDSEIQRRRKIEEEEHFKKLNEERSK